MVLSYGSVRPHKAASICNRNNVCGGTKKSGLAPTIGVFNPSISTRNRTMTTQYGLKCMGNMTNGSQSNAGR